MRKFSIVVVLLFGFLSTPAVADTLLVTGGRVVATEDSLWDTCGIGLTGNFVTSAGPGCGLSNYSPTDLLDGISGAVIRMAPFIINGRLYLFPDLPFTDKNMGFRFVHNPVPESAIHRSGSPPLLAGDEVSEPFTMTGTLLLRDAETLDLVTFDLVGQGVLDVAWVDRLIPPSSFPFLHVTYTFAVPEPSSLLLLLIAIGPLAVIAVRKKYRLQ